MDVVYLCGDLRLFNDVLRLCYRSTEASGRQSMRASAKFKCRNSFSLAAKIVFLTSHNVYYVKSPNNKEAAINKINI